MSTNNNNTTQQPTVISSFSVCKPGRTKFVPSVVKKQQESTLSSSSTQDKQSNELLNTEQINSNLNAPENSTSNNQQKITMAYYLKDRKEGIPMINSPVPKKGTKSLSPPPPQISKPRKDNTNRSMSSLVAPQIKLVDGKVVLDDSLLHSTISHSQIAEEMTVINETNRHLTSATFAKKRVTSNRWSPQETNLFFDAVRMCGTDFSMIESLLPHRSRSQIKGKYKIEERSNSGRLYQALDNPVPYDPKFTEKVNQILSEQNHSKNK
jgi:hypothetical protein